MEIGEVRVEKTIGVIGLHDPAVDKDGGYVWGDVACSCQSPNCRGFRLFYTPFFFVNRLQGELPSSFQPALPDGR